MSLLQFLLVLSARWKVIAVTVFVAVALTLTVSLLMPKEYKATTAVLVDVKSPDPLMGGVNAALIAPGYMTTQVDIVTSDRVAQTVVKTLGFSKSPQLVEQWREKTGGNGTLEAYYGELLQKKLEAKPSRDSSVISISFSAADPKFSAVVANAFAQAYIDTNIQLKVEPAKQYNAWFSSQTKQLREDLEAAQSRLSAYQRENGIISVDERLDVENARLNELNSQLTALEAQKSDASSRQRQAAARLEDNPDVINSPVIAALRSDLARLEAKLQELAGQLGKNHPQYQRQETEVVTLRQKMGEEMRKVASSLGAATQVNQQRESEVRGALAAQKKKVLELKQQRDEIMVLVRDVETAQRAYDLVNQRASQTSLESQTQQTNVVVLTPADEPISPASPRPVLYSIIAFFAGGMLGIALALVAELKNRRIRSAEDLADTLEIPVVATLTAPRRERGIRRLVRRFRPVAA